MKKILLLIITAIIIITLTWLVAISVNRDTFHAPRISIIGTAKANSGKDQPLTFPSCSNPSGDVLASFPSGAHAILNNPQNQLGSDNVFQVNDSQVLQCFCPSQGDGIQTDWLLASDLNDEQKQSLINQGWTLIPDGSDWGLTKNPYLAKNASFSCSQPSPSPTPEESATPSATPIMPSLPSVSSNSTPPGPFTAPSLICDQIKATPTVMAFSRNSPTSIHIEWSPSDPFVHDFVIQYGLTAVPMWTTVVHIDSGQKLETNLNFLPANHLLWVRVAGTEGGCLGAFSEWIDP